MGKQPEDLDDYPLFYEEIGHSRQGQALELEKTKKEAAYERSSSLSEGDVEQLSKDLRQPIKDSSSPTPRQQYHT